MRYIKPFVSSVELDDSVDGTADYWWTAGNVVIGDELTGEIFNDEYTLYICSPTFKKNPIPEFVGDTQSTYVQKSYNPEQAKNHIEQAISSIGKVSLEEFDNIASDYLYDEYYQWKFMSTNSEA